MRALFLACLAALLPLAVIAEAPSPGRQAFERLKACAGSWVGTVVKPDGPAAQVDYRVASGGTVVMETLFPGTDHEMITMYRLVGEDLVGTHYCAMGNQPRFKLVSFEADTLVFGFDGGDNLDPAVSVHIHEGTIRLLPEGRLEADWVVHRDGKAAGVNRFFLKKED